MINSRKELSFYLKADRMMNRGSFSLSIRERVKECFIPDYIMDFLSAMRHVSYYSKKRWGGVFKFFWLVRFKRLSLKLGFSIGPDAFGYGLVIPHYGTIVVGGSNSIGNYAVLHTSTCIVDLNSIIGDGLYLATGAIISCRVVLGDNVTIGANSVMNKFNEQNNVLFVGAPAYVKQGTNPWYLRDGERFLLRVQRVENLKKRMSI